MAPALGALGAIGLGMAIALTKAERTRRMECPPEAEPTTVPPPPQQRSGKASRPKAAPLQQWLPHVAREQLDLAIGLLEHQSGDSPAQTVHETRKALKRLRALARMLRHELGPEQSAYMNKALRDAGRRLAGARDAHVMVETLDGLIARHPKRLSDSRAVERLRVKLSAEYQRVEALTMADSAAREHVLYDLRELHTRIVFWTPTKHGFAIVRADLTRIYREGRRAQRTARSHEDGERLHDWRKRVKDLRYATELLGPKYAPRTRTVARRAQHLGELLGEEHDLGLLAARVRHERDCFAGEWATRKAMLKLIARRRRRLRRRAYSLGKRLYKPAPRAFARLIERP